MGFMFHGMGMFFGVIPLIPAVAGGIVLLRFLKGRKLSHQKNKNTANKMNSKNMVEMYENRVMKLADKRGGRLTLSDLVTATDISLQQAEKVMNSMTDNVRVRMEVLDSGIIVYEFPEIKERKNSLPDL